MDGTTATQTLGQLFGNNIPNGMDPNETVAQLFKDGLPNGTTVMGYLPQVD
jgi:hypothetical protein